MNPTTEVFSRGAPIASILSLLGVGVLALGIAS